MEPWELRQNPEVEKIKARLITKLWLSQELLDEV